MRLLIGILIFLISICQAFADTHEVTTCTVANVQAAVNAATAGDTVYLNCASATWSSYVNVSKGITIKGNGDTSTTITANNSALFNITLTSADDFRMYDIGFTGRGGEIGLETTLIRLRGTGHIGISRGTIWQSLRMDHLKFTNVSTYCITIDIWDEIPYHPKALFDHINYTNTGSGAICKFAGNNLTWTEADQYGTDYAFYIEDSTFSWNVASFDNYLTDTEHGVRMVIRHNTLTNGSVQMHDTGSTPGARGNRLLELYNNTFNCTGAECNNMAATALRGGSAIVFNNTMSSNYWTQGYAQIWRATVGDGYLGAACTGAAVRACNTSSYYHCTAGDKKWTGSEECNGKGSVAVACTSNSDCPIGVDGTATCLDSVDNVDGGNNASGYPCRDQTGWGQEYGTGGRYQYPSPVYWYNNGTTSTCASGGTCNNSATIAEDNAWFALNRDYCYHNPASNCGTKTAWTYTPYTYPHPLQAGTVLRAPKYLRVE